MYGRTGLELLKSQDAALGCFKGSLNLHRECRRSKKSWLYSPGAGSRRPGTLHDHRLRDRRAGLRCGSFRQSDAGNARGWREDHHSGGAEDAARASRQDRTDRLLQRSRHVFVLRHAVGRSGGRRGALVPSQELHSRCARFCRADESSGAVVGGRQEPIGQ
jgi:hypothetical protein